MTPTERLLRKLISIPSVNPSFLPPNHPRAGETRVARHLAVEASKAGLDIEWQNAIPGRANLLARLTPRKKPQRRILLAPHLDTVDISDESELRPRFHRGRWYGRGACDTKGSVAAMMSALCQIAKHHGSMPGTEIMFAGFVDEEMGQAGSRAFADSGIPADLAIVGEPTQLQVVTCHKGNLWLKLDTQGREAHGSKPELGRNAIHEMARIVDVLETDYAAALRKRRHPLLGHATVNVGTIHGGKQPNIVPAQCCITVDRRTLPGESEKGVHSEIQAMLHQHALKTVIAETKVAPCLAMETNPKLPLVQSLMRCAGQRLAKGVDYFCDASVLSSGGIPSVVFGPGDIAQAHTADEWIDAESLEQSVQILVNYLCSLP